MIEAEDLLDGDDVRVPAGLAGAVGDGLLVAVRAAVTAPGGERVPEAVLTLLDALQASASRALAGSGQSAMVAGSVGDVALSWVGVAEAHRATGVPPRTLTRWASAGVVDSRRIGRRALLLSLSDVYTRLGRR